jgi:hypothetical protein
VALNIFSFFSPRANNVSSDYPTGSFKDRSLPGLYDGTPILAADRNDLQGFTDALLLQGGVTRSGNPDTVGASDRMTALNNIIRLRTDYKPVSGGGTFVPHGRYWITDSGTYNLPPIVGLTNGVKVDAAWERPDIPVINVFSGAGTTIELPNGAIDTTLECDLIVEITFVYNATANKWEVR